MKLIESPGRTTGKGILSKFVDQLKKLISSRKTDIHAEDAITTHFLRGLDNRFVMLHNLPVEGTNDTFPPIVVGPTGLVVINISSIKGIFRAREDSWWEMSKTSHRYNPAKLNLVKETQEYAQKLAAVLDKHQKSHPQIVPVLVFANPGVDIELTNPAIRIVLMDGVDNLIGSLLNSEVVLKPNEINSLADALEVMGDPDKAIPIGDGEDFFGKDLLEPPQKFSFKLPKLKLPSVSLASIEENFKFTPRQWLIIEILMVLVIVILVAAIVYVLLAY